MLKGLWPHDYRRGVESMAKERSIVNDPGELLQVMESEGRCQKMREDPVVGRTTRLPETARLRHAKKRPRRRIRQQRKESARLTSDGAKFSGTCFTCGQRGRKAAEFANGVQGDSGAPAAGGELQQPRQTPRRLSRPERRAVSNHVR